MTFFKITKSNSLVNVRWIYGITLKSLRGFLFARAQLVHFVSNLRILLSKQHPQWTSRNKKAKKNRVLHVHRDTLWNQISSMIEKVIKKWELNIQGKKGSWFPLWANIDQGWLFSHLYNYALNSTVFTQLSSSLK